MHPHLMRNLLRAVYWFDDAVQENMAAQGFPRTSRAVSFILLNIAQGEHRATNIAKNLGVSRQAVGAMLVELRERGMIHVRKDPTNGRNRIVSFSREYADRGAACVEILTKLEKELGKRIGMKVLEAMKSGLGADWGVSPRLGELSRQEILRGKARWNVGTREVGIKVTKTAKKATSALRHTSNKGSNKNGKASATKAHA